MADFLLSDAANARLDEIWRYTVDNWGDEQAERYIRQLFTCFERIAVRDVVWRPIPAEFGVKGFWYRCESHYIYWRKLADGRVGIVTVLHKRMHQVARFREAQG